MAIPSLSLPFARHVLKKVACRQSVRLALLTGLLSLPLAVQAEQADEVAQRVQQQVEHWLQQAEQGDAAALFNLGQFYRKGVGMPPDRVQAERFYRQAAERGHMAAQLNLGTLYYFDPSGQPNYEQARHWWQQAAQQGDATAAYQLALLYLNGGDQPPDAEQALHWMGKAKSAGHPDAAAALEQMRALEGQGEQSYTVQLGSFSDLGAAQSAGKRFRDSASEVLGGLTIQINPARTADGKMLYRVHTGQFIERTGADALCERLRGRSLTCFVARH